MNEQDLRDCFAMFALAGSLMSGEPRSAEEVWEIADLMLATRIKKEPEVGIKTVKRTRKTND
jgi:mannose/cellobiose epimerase-like protein (N-acyl-D-glucosamine 2-epimerase family)